MNKFFLAIIGFTLLSISSFANPIRPHSCYPQGKFTDYCNCEFLSRTSGREVFKGQVLCSVLKCNDYRTESAPEMCSQGAKAVTCNLTNPGYAGYCQQTFPMVDSETFPQNLCNEVLGCLSNPLCIANYCRSTTIRQGWKLHSISVEETTYP